MKKFSNNCFHINSLAMVFASPKGYVRLAFLCVWYVLSVTAANAQSHATFQQLILYELLENASNSYPALRAARFEAVASAEDTTAVRRQFWPAMSVTSESNSGNLRSFPTNALQVQQTIWDFGRLSARVDEAVAAADLSLLNAYLQQQELFLQIVSAE